jgi:outer membrane protein TolC
MRNLNFEIQKNNTLRASLCFLASCAFISTALAQVPSKFRFADLAGQDVIDLPQVESDFPPPAAQSTDKGLGLPDIVALSLQQSPQIRQARAQYESAEARLGMARSDLLPSASLRIAKGPEKSESTSITTDTGKHTYYSRTMRLTQPVFNAPVFKEFDSSRQTKDASSLRFQSMREATSLAAAKATIDVATARITLNFSDAQLEQLNKILSYLEARTSAGASSQADLERARTRVLAARQTRLEQQTNYRNAMFELDRLTGAMPTALQLPFLQLLPALPDNYGQIRQYVKEQNFDLLALRKEVNAQRSTVSGEYGKYLPVFGVSLEKDTTENVRGINAPWTDTRALAVMTWNISLGGKEYFSAQQSGAELRNREAKLDDETQRVSQATEADIALLQSTELRLQAAEAEQTSALSVVNAVEEQLKSGRIGSLLEALDASDRLFGARFRLTQALGQQMKAHAQLLSRLGMLSDVQTQAKL